MTYCMANVLMEMFAIFVFACIWYFTMNPRSLIANAARDAQSALNLVKD